MNGKKLIPVKDAAEKMGKHVTTLYGMEKAGKIKLTRRTKGGRVLVYMTQAQLDKNTNHVKTDKPEPKVKGDDLDRALDSLKQVILKREDRLRKEVLVGLADALKEEVKKPT